MQACKIVNMLDKENQPAPLQDGRLDVGPTKGSFLKRGSRPVVSRPGRQNALSKSNTAKALVKDGSTGKQRPKSEPNKTRPRPVMQESNQVETPIKKETEVPQPPIPLIPSTFVKQNLDDSSPDSSPGDTEGGKGKQGVDSAGIIFGGKSSDASSSTKVSPDRSNLYVPPSQRTRTPEVIKKQNKTYTAYEKGYHTVPINRGPHLKNLSNLESPPSGPSTPKRTQAKPFHAPQSPATYFPDYYGAHTQPMYPPYTPHPRYYDPSSQYDQSPYLHHPPGFAKSYDYLTANPSMELAHAYEMTYNPAPQPYPNQVISENSFSTWLKIFHPRPAKLNWAQSTDAWKWDRDKILSIPCTLSPITCADILFQVVQANPFDYESCLQWWQFIIKSIMNFQMARIRSWNRKAKFRFGFIEANLQEYWPSPEHLAYTNWNNDAYRPVNTESLSVRQMASMCFQASSKVVSARKSPSSSCQEAACKFLEMHSIGDFNVHVSAS